MRLRGHTHVRSQLLCDVRSNKSSSSSNTNFELPIDQLFWVFRDKGLNNPAY